MAGTLKYQEFITTYPSCDQQEKVIHENARFADLGFLLLWLGSISIYVLHMTSSMFCQVGLIHMQTFSTCSQSLIFYTAISDTFLHVIHGVWVTYFVNFHCHCLLGFVCYTLDYLWNTHKSFQRIYFGIFKMYCFCLASLHFFSESELFTKNIASAMQASQCCFAGVSSSLGSIREVRKAMMSY